MSKMNHSRPVLIFASPFYYGRLSLAVSVEEVVHMQDTFPAPSIVHSNRACRELSWGKQRLHILG